MICSKCGHERPDAFGGICEHCGFSYIDYVPTQADIDDAWAEEAKSKHVIENKLHITFEKYDKADFTAEELRLIKKMAKEFEASVRKEGE